VVTFAFVEEVILSILSDLELIHESKFACSLMELCGPLNLPVDGDDTEIKSYMDTSSYVSAYQCIYMLIWRISFSSSNYLLARPISMNKAGWSPFDQETKNRVMVSFKIH